MNALLTGIVPVFAMIALGWGLKKRAFLADDGWRAVERLTYFAFYPAFLIPAVWRADFAGGTAGPVALGTVGAAMVVAGLTVLAKPALRISDPAFTSVFQGVIRWNGFVFLPVAGAVFGPTGLGVAAVAFGVLAPALNVVCVLVLARWGAGQGGGWRLALASLARNPIIWACGIGAALNLTGVPKPDLVMGVFDLMGPGAIALGLITAGAGLSFRYAASRPVLMLSVTVIKLILLPVGMYWLTGVLGGDRMAQGLALLAGASPGAAASYVMARQMGGDAPLMAGVVAMTTVVSAFTIPVLLALFGYI
ncbi:MAG: AEC family transporter [Alphaproteobacteria bacterium]|jgi:malonate transporter and related proteins|nr:AEC family transporter [Alphaproteobacteria bacterium]MBU2043041.1 AEC family transporter [Alphaproteobacteria bacterium]MBU2126531.1 AEC family transporter [Alphaproteobacteria bacterium]MBU2208535.1 AEC family transporter [Alphaproteobacteria bacterium]MBU2290623.1 AEC family transporter [Alphaproteobacteria bacterium]